MGTTFATIQVQNREHIEPEQFKNTLIKYLKRKGLTPVTEEKAQISYRIAFSGDGKWITLSSSAYEIGSTSVDGDIKGLAKVLKTCCIGTSVFDSDSVFLFLFDAPAKKKDIVALGRMEDMPVAEYTVGTGKQECWSPLLAESATWKQLTEIWNGDYTFAEDALAMMATLLSMDSRNIVTDYQYWDEQGTDEPTVITLHFETPQSMFVSDGPTKLVFSPWTSATMVSEVDNSMSFYNAGGISKGLTVLFLGDCFEQDMVEIKELVIQKHKNPRMKANEWPAERETITAHPVKEKTSDRRWGLSFEIDDFEFPEGVNTEHSSFNSKKGFDTIFTHSVFLQFKAVVKSGAHHCYSLHVIPQTNWKDGQAGWMIQLYETQEQMNKERTS